MLYGSKNEHKKYRDGQVVDSFTTYSESLRISDDSEVLAQFLKLMSHVKLEGRFNPSFEVETDRKTGKAYRIIKSWCEVS